MISHLLFAMMLPNFIVVVEGTVAQSPSSPHSSMLRVFDVSASSSDDAKKRSTYSLGTKQEILAKVDGMLDKDNSASASNLMAHMGLSHFYYGCWKKDLKQAEDMAHSSNSTSSTLAAPVSSGLSRKNSAIPATTLHVILEANQLSSDKFKEKSRVVKADIVCCFVTAVGVGYTHVEFPFPCMMHKSCTIQGDRDAGKELH
jgi:hypothetical protein